MQTTAIPALILKLNDIINQVAKKYNYKKTKVDKSEDGNYYGIWYFDNDNKETLWIGYDYDIWLNEKVALIIQANQKVNPKAFQKFADIFKDEGIKYFKKDKDLIFLEIPNETNSDKDIVNQITKLIEKFHTTGV